MAERTQRTQQNNGWNNITVKARNKEIEGRYKTRHQMTIELGAPYAETITIESSDPFTDVDFFAREMIIAAEMRHEARRKRLILDNRETMQETIIPLWLEREAFIAHHKARMESLRKESKRRLLTGKRSPKAHNDFVRSLKDDTDDEDYIDILKDYNKRLNHHLKSLGVPKEFHMSRHDIYDLLGRGWWERLLQVREFRGRQRYEVLSEVKRNMELFNRLYNLEPQSLTADEVLNSYDTIVTIGFGDIILAAALKRGDDICAVMAIDNEQGRRALRHLVDETRLKELLPKRVFNAIARHELSELHDLTYHTDTTRDTILIIE